MGETFHELISYKSEIIYENEEVSVSTLPLDHRVYTNGFLFKTKSLKRKIDPKAINKLNLEPFQFDKLRKGLSI